MNGLERHGQSPSTVINDFNVFGLAVRTAGSVLFFVKPGNLLNPGAGIV